MQTASSTNNSNPDDQNLDNKPNCSRAAIRQSLLEMGFGQVSTYQKLNALGSGNYSTVYKGLSHLTKKLVALKEINMERDEGVPFTAIREVSLLKSLKHSNIITLHDIIYTGKTLTLVFEYIDRDLGRYLLEYDYRIKTHNVKLFLYQLLRGLKYCHDRRILHRDLKPQNILISLNGDLKLADFGLARAKSLPTKTFTDVVVTLWYRPPDVLLGNVDYSTSIDIWGVGCIFFEMITGFAPFQGTSTRKQLESIFEIIGTPDASSWPTFKEDIKSCSIDLPHYPGRNLSTLAPGLDDKGQDLLRKMLCCNPLTRIPAGDAITHSYFKFIHDLVRDLDDSHSIFSVPEIKLEEEQHQVMHDSNLLDNSHPS